MNKDKYQLSIKHLRQVHISNFNDVIWEGTRNTWVAVGAAGSIFTAVGLTTGGAFSQFSGTLQTLNAVCYAQSEYIAVGNGGAIIASNDGFGWSDKVSNTLNDLNDIIYDGNRFIVVGDSGTIGISTDKNFSNLGVNSYQLGTQHPATFDFAKLSSLIISTLVLVQLVICITHLTLQTGMREQFHIQMKFVILFIHLMVILQVEELLLLVLQPPPSMQIQLSTEQLQPHQ